MKIDIVDNFLSYHYADSLFRTFRGIKDEPGHHFPWFFADDLNHQTQLGNYYFTNIVVDNYEVVGSPWLLLFEPLLSNLSINLSDVSKRVKRIKANMYPRTQFRVHHSSHTDYDPNLGLRTCLYYVNTNDGVTIFDGKRKIKSRKNRALFFDGSTRHHSTTPTKCNWRCSINIDYRD